MSEKGEVGCIRLLRACRKNCGGKDSGALGADGRTAVDERVAGLLAAGTEACRPLGALSFGRRIA